MSSSRSPAEYDVVIGKTIKRIRQERGLGQAQLAEAIGLSFQQVQKYEQGTNRIATSRLIGIAEALSCNLGELLEGVESPSTQSLSLANSPRDTQRLAAAFDRIEDAVKRYAILQLVQTVSRSEEAEP